MERTIPIFVVPGLYRPGQSRILPGDEPANKAQHANRPVVPLVVQGTRLWFTSALFAILTGRMHVVDQLSWHDTLQL